MYSVINSHSCLGAELGKLSDDCACKELEIKNKQKTKQSGQSLQKGTQQLK